MLHSRLLRPLLCICKQTSICPFGVMTHYGIVLCMLPLRVESHGLTYFVLLDNVSKILYVLYTLPFQCSGVVDMYVLAFQQNPAFGDFHYLFILFPLWAHSWCNALVLAEVHFVPFGISVHLFQHYAPCRRLQLDQFLPLIA